MYLYVHISYPIFITLLLLPNSQDSPQGPSRNARSSNLHPRAQVFWGIGIGGQWLQLLWFALGISLECLYFKLKGSGYCCGFFAFVILSSTPGLLDSAEAGRQERDSLLLFWFFWLLSPWGVTGEEEAGDTLCPSVPTCEMGDRESGVTCGTLKLLFPLPSCILPSIITAGLQSTQVEGHLAAEASLLCGSREPACVSQSFHEDSI